MKLAIFDFDGTLYSFETFPFLISQLKEQKSFKSLYYKFMARFAPVYLMYKLKLVSRYKMRYRATKEFINLFTGKTKDEIDDFYMLAFENMKDKENELVSKEIASLREKGYKTVIVSGAVQPLLEIVGKKLGFDLTIGTQFPMTNGSFKGAKEIDYIQDKRKVTVVEEKFADENIDWGASIAYADSISDLFLLEKVGTPVAVNPDETLKKIALERNWSMMN